MMLYLFFFESWEMKAKWHALFIYCFWENHASDTALMATNYEYGAKVCSMGLYGHLVCSGGWLPLETLLYIVLNCV